MYGFPVGTCTCMRARACTRMPGTSYELRTKITSAFFVDHDVRTKTTDAPPRTYVCIWHAFCRSITRSYWYEDEVRAHKQFIVLSAQLRPYVFLPTLMNALHARARTIQSDTTTTSNCRVRVRARFAAPPTGNTWRRASTPTAQKHPPGTSRWPREVKKGRLLRARDKPLHAVFVSPTVSSAQNPRSAVASGKNKTKMDAKNLR